MCIYIFICIHIQCLYVSECMHVSKIAQKPISVLGFTCQLQ